MRKTMLVKLVPLALCSVLLACGGGSADPTDPPVIDAPGTSGDLNCGKQGDPGNEMGVGKYCTMADECAGQAAGICAIIGDPRAHFCTKGCISGPTNPCGAGASCQCQGGLCGCTPDACL